MAKWKAQQVSWGTVAGKRMYAISPDPITDPEKEEAIINVFGDKLKDTILNFLNDNDVKLED